MLLLGCATEAPVEPNADALYLRALGQESADAAGLICGDAPAGAVRGECLLFAARELGHPDGLLLCEDGVWGDICRFELADQGALVGDAAREACSRTGDFEAQCRQHALQRELEALASTAPPWNTGAVFAAYGRDEDPLFLAALHAASGEPCRDGDACELVDAVLGSWAGTDPSLDDQLGTWRMRERPRWTRQFPPR